MVAYANEQKIDALGVPVALIQENGAVSEACALAMAEGARHKYGVDLAIATTGIAGPGGGTKEKPVGLVYIAVSTKSVQLCKPFRLFGNREQIIQRSSNAALWLVKRALNLPTHVGA
jgi:nicotinamide-nucleotide amidase